MSNKIFCTFTKKDQIEKTLEELAGKYPILFSKIFVFESDGLPDELVCTYNIDLNNFNIDNIFPGTILMHRKKETATLFTINALNKLVSSLNNGIFSKDFQINWNDYKKCILLTRNGEFAKIETKIHTVFNL